MQSEVLNLTPEASPLLSPFLCTSRVSAFSSRFSHKPPPLPGLSFPFTFTHHGSLLFREDLVSSTSICVSPSSSVPDFFLYLWLFIFIFSFLIFHQVPHSDPVCHKSPVYIASVRF